MSDYNANVQPDRTWKKDDAFGKDQKCEISGIQFFVSDAPHNDYRRQFNQAAAFLSANKDWLRALTKDPRVEEGFLDFGLIQDSYPAYFRRLPLSLIQWSAVCGVEIELSFFAISDKPDDISEHHLRAKNPGIAEQSAAGKPPGSRLSSDDSP